MRGYLSTILLLALLSGCGRPQPPDGSSACQIKSMPPSFGFVRDQIADRALMTYNGEAIREQLQQKGLLLETTETIPFDTTREAVVLINMARGNLTLASGSEELLTARFLYNQRQPSPSLSYETIDEKRIIEVLGTGRDNDWRLFLSEYAPFVLKIESQGGFRDFNFDNVPVTIFNLRAMDGITVAEFPGDMRYLEELDIRQRRGSLSIAATGHLEALAEAVVQTARGDVSARFTGFYDRLEKLDVGTLEGDVELDLTGAWQRTCRIRVTGTCGNLFIRIPGGLGATVVLNHFCASTHLPGMYKAWSSKGYVNPAFHKTKVFLDIEVDATCGRIDVIQDPLCCPLEEEAAHPIGHFPGRRRFVN